MTAAATLLDLEAIPFPVAYPLSFALEPSLSPSDRLDNLVFTAYQAMRTAGLIMLADYLDVEATDENVQKAIRGLRQPHWGEWTVLNQKLCRFWTEASADCETRFQTVVDGWRTLGDRKGDRPWAELLKGMPGTDGPARNANDAMQKLRNDRTHRMGTRTPERGDEQAMLERVVPLVSAMCATLFPTGAVRLLRRVSNDGAPLSVIRVHGPHQDLTFSAEPFDPVWSGLFARTGVAAISAGQGVSVYPLFAPDDDEPGRRAEMVTLVDGISKKTVVLLGVRSCTENARLLGPLMDAFARKSVDFGLGRAETTAWTIAEWARATAREEVEELRGHKYFPECYVERPSVDRRAEQCLARGGSALLILGDAGSGKSSLIARLVERLTADPVLDADSGRAIAQPPSRALGREGRDVVVFLAGRQAYAGDLGLGGHQLLAEAVFRRAGIKSGAFRDLDHLIRYLAASAALDWSGERRLWLVLDGLNEADRFLDLLAAVDALLPAVAGYPWLRIVLSMRRGAYDSLERRHDTQARHGAVFANERHLARFHDDPDGGDVEGSDRPYLDVRPFDTTLGSIAYQRRAEAFPDRACNLPYDRLPTDVRTLLLNPLHLHVFHETYAGRLDVAADLDAPTLLGRYLDRLCTDLPSMKKTLAAVGEHMVAHDTPVLPVDVADTWLSEWRAHAGFNGAARVVKLDPIEELVSASILMRPARDGFGAHRTLVAFTFSHQRICEQVIVRALRRSVEPRVAFQADDLARFAEHATGRPGFVEYLGAIRVIVGHAARTGDGDLVASLLGLPQAEVRRELLGAAVKALGLAWGKEESGRPGPRASLTALADASLKTDEARRAWLESSDVLTWLARRGASYASLAVAQSRVAALGGTGDFAAGEQAHEVEEFLALADAFERVGRSSEVRRHTEGAAALARRVVAHSPEQPEHQDALASTLRALGSLDREEGQLRRAREYLEEALSISRRLVDADPGNPEYLRSLSSACDDMGDLEQDARRHSAALALYEETLAIDRRLAANEPDDLQLSRNVAHACDTVGDMAFHDGDLARARPLYEEALALRRKVAAAEPDRVDFARRVASGHKALGRLELEAGRLEAARTHLEAALAINRRLAAMEPDRADFADSLSTALDRMGNLESSANRVELARAYYEEALQVDRRLARLLPSDARLGRAVSYGCDRLGELALEAGDLDQAKAYFEEALATDRQLTAASPELRESLSFLGESLSRLVAIARRRGDIALANAYSEEALEISIRLLDPDDPESLNDLARDARSVARTRFTQGDVQGALALADTALEHARRAAVTRGEPRVRDTVAALLELRAECVRSSAPDEARAAFMEAIDIRREIVREDPGEDDYRAGLVGVLRAAAEIAGAEPRASMLEEARAVESGGPR